VSLEEVFEDRLAERDAHSRAQRLARAGPQQPVRPQPNPVQLMHLYYQRIQNAPAEVVCFSAVY